MENTQEDMNEITPRLNSKTGGSAFTVSLVIFLLTSFAVALIQLAAKLEEGSDLSVYLSYLASPIAIAISGVIILKFGKLKLGDVFPVKTKPKYFLIGLLLIFGLLFSLGWINSVSVEFFKLFGYKPREAKSYFPDLSGGKVVLGLLIIAVLPAVLEEFLFRGVIFNNIEGSVGSIRSIFIVGFCFSLFHGSPEQTLYQFITGCVFAFLAMRSGSILPTVMMHFINNALIVIFEACNLFNEEGNLIISNTANIVLTVVSALSLISGILWLVFDKTELKKCQKGGVKTFFLYAAPAIGILGLIWILSLFGVA